MRFIRSMSKAVLKISSGLITLVSLLNLVFESGGLREQRAKWLEAVEKNPELQWLISAAILVLCVLLIISLAVTLIGERTSCMLKVGSWRFDHFFTRWYSRTGQLCIVCDDLEWVSDRIRVPLIKKAREKRLILYLSSGMHSELVEELKRQGAEVRSVSPLITQHFSLSIRRYMGDISQAIIREKNQALGDSIRFKELREPYCSRLLSALFEELNRLDTRNTSPSP